MTFADRLKEARLRKGYTQEQIAEKIGVAKSTYTGYEKGNREPNVNTIGKLMEEFDVDANFLWQDETTFPFELTYDEMENLVKKYRSLDTHGKSHVDSVLDWEAERMHEIERLKEQSEQIKKVSSPAEIIPMRFLAYYQRMASAGSGEFLFPDIPTEVIAVPDTPLSRKADFVIGVNGKSMENTYFDGDKVLVEKTNDVPIGEIGIFVRGEECFIKEAGKDRLISHNADKEQYPDIIPDERRIDTIGRVLGKIGE